MYRFAIVIIGILFLSVSSGCAQKHEESVKPEETAPKPMQETEKKPETVPTKSEPNKETVAVIETNLGKIVFKFYFDDAPKHCKNFIDLAKSGFYNGLTFHRIVPGFVIQGGCPKGDGTGGPGYTIPAEFNSRKHILGTVAMARAQDPDSAGCQFYICLADLPQLDGNYTVFGQVIEGIEVVQKIGQVETEWNERPKIPVIMNRVTIEEREMKR